MLHCFDPIRTLTFWAILVRLSLAVVCGGVIGAERETKRRPAGFRTHILICLGAAITTLTSQYLLLSLHLFTDVARLGAQVISGIGFIGAGTIIVTRDKRVKGLTTAAGLWAAAIIGLACGAGYVECAAFATLVVLVVELVLIRLEFKLTSKNTDLTLYIEYAHAVCMESVLALLRERRVQIESLEISRIADTDAPDAPHHYCALIPIHSRAPLRPGDLRNDLAAPSLCRLFRRRRKRARRDPARQRRRNRLHREEGRHPVRDRGEVRDHLPGDRRLQRDREPEPDPRRPEDQDSGRDRHGQRLPGGDRHIKARALYAARDLTEADGRLVIRQACAAGRVAHEHRMHPRQPPQRAHDAHRAGAAVHARDAQDHVRHFCRRLS